MTSSGEAKGGGKGEGLSKLFSVFKGKPPAEEFPLLPLRELVLFPQTVIPMFITYRSGIAAVDAALARDQRLFAACLKATGDAVPASGKPTAGSGRPTVGSGKASADNPGAAAGSGGASVVIGSGSTSAAIGSSGNGAYPGETHSVGTVVRILQHLKLPDNTYRVVLQGEYRATIISSLDLRDHINVKI
jgi:ATP-dependent Lon protease